MSDPGGFDLEPTRESPPPAAPRRAALRSTRGVRARRSPARAESATPSGPSRYVGWLLAARLHYAVSLLFGAGVLLALYNPSWGVHRLWPHEALGLGRGALGWSESTGRLVALVLLILMYLVALFWRPGRGRGLWVMAAVAIAFVAFGAQARQSLVPLVGAAAVAGALLAAGPQTDRARRGLILLLGLLLLAGYLLLPWPAASFHRGIDLAPDYQATAFDVIDAHAAPSAQVLEEHGWLWLVLSRLGSSVPLLLAGMGLLALVGLGARWARWTAGGLLLLAVLGSAWHIYGGAPGDSSCETALSGLALAWFGAAAFAAHLLGLSAAFGDLMRRRSGP